MIRQPAVAGRFYPANPEELSEMIREFLNDSATKTPAIGIVAPHAGYIYSGHVAGAVYSIVDVPRRCIVMCPNHTGYGPPLSIMKSGAWTTPFGQVAVDEPLSTALMRLDPMLEHDLDAHRYEHAAEVHLPFLQQIVGTNVSFVPITVGTGSWAELEALGEAIAATVRASADPVLIVASSDLNHYESDSITRVKDRKAIDKMLELDPRGLLETVRREKISMCGYGPSAAMIVAAKRLGATTAELVKYATSAETSGDFARVVGYAGIVVR